MNAIQFLEREHDKAKAAFGKLMAAAPADRGRLWKALQHELKAHEEVEEACLYGPIEEEGVDDEKLTAWVSDLHEEQVSEVEELIEQTDQLDPREPSWLATVRKIHEALARHIRQEEGEIFPRISTVWGAERLEKAGVQMSDMQGKAARR